MSARDPLSAHVIVVGGGPAGTSAAITCRHAGLRVALFEAREFPRERPGEALPPGIDVYFDELGVTQRILEGGPLRYRGNQMQWEDRPELVTFGLDARGNLREGWQVPRTLLDTVLLDEARRLGVAVLQPCMVRGLYRWDGRVAGVLTDRGPFSADFVVDAGGPRHWMARKMRLGISYLSPRLFGAYGWARGDCSGRDQIALYQADRQGWTWTSRVAPRLYQWTRMTFSREPVERNWLPAEYRGLIPVGPARGADFTWRRVRKPAGAGFFLAGDALAATDPIVQTGVYKAILSGMKVALLLDRILNQREPEEEVAAEYSRWVNELYLGDLPALRNFYARHGSAPEPLKALQFPSGEG